MVRASSILMQGEEFAALCDRLRVEGRSEPRPEDVRAAMSLVTEGIIVSAAEPPALPALPETGIAQAGRPQPYALSFWEESAPNWTAANHRLELDIHGISSMTHIDSLDHFRWGGRSQTNGDLLDLRKGIVSRGVLLDVPGVLGVDVPPGHVITLDEVTEALRRQRVALRPGDALHIRLGREGVRSSHADLSADPMPGLSIECAEWLASAAPSVVITDAGLDVNPSEVDGIPVPWHILTLTALAVPLVDMADLVGLAETCSRLGRYEFASVLAPLPIPGSTGSPLNPLAIF